MQAYLRASTLENKRERAGIFGASGGMNPAISVRRATVADRDALKAIWSAMQLPAEELEPRLTEFQVVELNGGVNGAIGLVMQQQHGLLHSEGYLDFSIADRARELFWERIQKLASHHGVFRLWTQENSPFWLHWGFQPADEILLQRLPADWKRANGKWFTLELKNEEAINAALGTQFAGHLADERKQAERITGGARKLKLTVTVLCFGVAIICFAVAVYLFMHHLRGAIPR
jgi:N-acetylglutamate synthase-like GNAT family acetyltransferase